MKFLNSEQNARFAEVNARCGLGPEEFTAQLAVHEFAALSKTRIMASTGQSDFPARVISVGSIEDMRKLLGHSGPYVPPPVGSEPDYPPPPTQGEIDAILNAVRNHAKPQINEELKGRIEQAATAYALGNPEKVAAYVPLINALKFPSRVAVFTGETLDVPGGTRHVLKGEDPMVLNYGQISVGSGGTIKVNANTFINAQLFEHAPAAAAALGDPAYTFDFSGQPWDTPADQGGQGPTGPVQTNHGTNGASSYNSGNCQWECSTQPQNGPQGNDGLKGHTGTPGAKGRPSPAGAHRLGLLKSPITVLIGAGNGQQGGKGGLGGAGGPGGQKGDPANGCSNKPSDGIQGRGGQGGDGGPGGPGGDSGYITMYYSWTGSGEPIKVTVGNVNGGAGGLPGDPGPGVGNNGSGNTGTPPGAPGPTPKFALNRE